MLRKMLRRLRPAEEPAPVAPPFRLAVPERFNRNSFKVSSLMPAEESGAWLLERMRQQIGLKTYAESALLDFGCGVRSSQAILNKQIPIGSYAGIDCFAEMIDFLRSAVPDSRFSYHFLDAYHPFYNPNGTP